MIRKLFKSQRKSNSILAFEKNSSLAIQNHFHLTNNQMLVVIWFKGLWTGVLLSLILHYFISH